MLTIFTIPKPFRGHITIIQRNAIQSWLRLRPVCELILFGDDEGTAEVADEFGVRYIPEVARNEYGTPLINDLFAKAQTLANSDFLCYVNADIILMSDFMEAVQQITSWRRRFLIVGQRWDIDLDKLWNFENNDWEKKLRSYVAKHGVIHPPSGSDYFIFPKGILRTLPPFAVGRPGWDNWVIYHARAIGIPVIDATPMVTVVHQNHDYSHVFNKTDEPWEGPESNLNRDLIGSWDRVFTLQDANWVLTPQGLRRPKWTRERLRRYMKTLPILHPRLRLLVSLGQALWRRIPKTLRISHQR